VDARHSGATHPAAAGGRGGDGAGLGLAVAPHLDLTGDVRVGGLAAAVSCVDRAGLTPTMRLDLARMPVVAA